MFSCLQNSNNVAWETGQCGNTRSTFLPCNNYLERSSGCSLTKDLVLQFTAVASCFIPTSLASVGTCVSNLFWRETDENITCAVRPSSVVEAVNLWMLYAFMSPYKGVPLLSPKNCWHPLWPFAKVVILLCLIKIEKSLWFDEGKYSVLLVSGIYFLGPWMSLFKDLVCKPCNLQYLIPTHRKWYPQ